MRVKMLITTCGADSERSGPLGVSAWYKHELVYEVGEKLGRTFVDNNFAVEVDPIEMDGVAEPSEENI